MRIIPVCAAALFLGLVVNNPTFAASTVEDFQVGTLFSSEGSSVVTYDWDGDGDQDYLIGAPLANANGAFSGRIVLRSQQNDPTPISGILEKVGEGPGDLFGGAMAIVGDLNCDSFPEVLVTAPNGNSTQGKAYVIDVRAIMAGSSGVLATVLPHSAGGNQAFGAKVVRLSNSKVAIASPKSDQLKGRVEIWSISAPNCNAVAATWISSLSGAALGADAGAEFGSCLAALSNVDNGTEIDLAVGAFRWGTPNLGRAFVFRGEDLTLWGQSIAPALNAATLDSQFGVSCADAGDSNHDGRSDLAIGAPFQDTTMPDSGKVYVFASPGTANGSWANLGTLGVNCDRCQQGSAITGILSQNPNDPNALVFGMDHLGFTTNVGGAVVVNNDSSVPGHEFALADLRFGSATREQFGSYVAQIGDLNNNGKMDDYVIFGSGVHNIPPIPDSPPILWTYSLGNPLSAFTGAIDNNIAGGACPGLGSIAPSIDQISTAPSGLPVVIGCQTQNCSAVPSQGRARCCQPGEIPGCAVPQDDPNCGVAGHAPCCAQARIFGSGFEPSSPTASTYNVALCAIGGDNRVFNQGLSPGCQIDVWPIATVKIPINSNGDLVDPHVMAAGSNPYANSTATGVNLFYFASSFNSIPVKIQCMGTHANFSGPISNSAEQFGNLNEWQVSNWIDMAISY